MSESAPAWRSQPRVQVDRKVLRDGVFNQLVEMLLGERFAPGASLNIDGLARELGVSPTPVREALVQLEHTGLISRVALRGYRVSAPLTTEEIGQLNDARMIVELGALDIALQEPDSLKPLLEAAQAHHREMVEAIREAPALTDKAERIAAYRRYFEADWAFHLAIMRHANNRFILQMADSLGSHIHRLRQTVELGLTDMGDALLEHGRILLALENDDPVAMRAALRAHLTAVRSRSLADKATEQILHAHDNDPQADGS
ncbi:GntR family transcriptional regulator [Cellulomonas sp. P24]|uniref:GntR family transcriptional regulator n=1 Tax=Cellulomonas sp. P24 TaxID=2885206 RepID=UPI00216B519B|nr:GntR family transcriptional regulator [Cellulomonas sp. P24]MCR6493686.1 GntR family transcriptional regulator [Cellulomonas sp. P24]